MTSLRQLVTKATLGATAAGFMVLGTSEAQSSASCASNKNCCFWPDGSLAGEFVLGTCCCVIEVPVGTPGARKFIIGGSVKYFKMITYSCNHAPEDC